MSKTHCIRGHEFDIENTYWMPNGARMCKRCQRERQTRYRRERGVESREPTYEKMLARFWSKVKKTRTCWLWKSTINPGGYGRFWVTPRVSVMAHRFAYELEVAEIPEGMTLDHLCYNPSCVNPAHLEPVELLENIRRSRKRLTGEEVITYG